MRQANVGKSQSMAHSVEGQCEKTGLENDKKLNQHTNKLLPGQFYYFAPISQTIIISPNKHNILFRKPTNSDNNQYGTQIIFSVLGKCRKIINRRWKVSFLFEMRDTFKKSN